jgi:pyruvate/2-oxoglutarate dehydrogenase complex dihydrolipoamide dehydrogenase (E3) component
VNDQLEATVPGVWPLGDCLTERFYLFGLRNDFEIVVAKLLDGGSRRVSDGLAASALFTDPPVGRVGLTEAEARRQAGRHLG